MGVWHAPRPGGTRTPVARPGATLASVAAAGGTWARLARPGGTQWRLPRPGGTRWVGVEQPTLPRPTEVAAAAFTATADLSVVTMPVLFAGAGFATEATLSVSSAQRLELLAALGADASLSVEVEVVGESFENDAHLAAEASLSVQAFPRFARTADLAAEGTLSVQAFPRFTRTADLAAEGTLSVQAFPRFARVADYSTEATLSVVVSVVPQRAAAFVTEGTLAVVSFPRFSRAAELATEGTLSVVVLQRTNWSDNFNRANGALGSDWTGFPLGTDTTVVPEINANALRAKSTATNNQNNQCIAIATAAAAECVTDDMATRGTMLAGENGLIFGPIVRASSDGQNCVMADITSDSAVTGIWTRIAGTWTRRTTSATTAYAAADVFELRAVGNVYTLARNPAGANTTISTWTDSGNAFPTGAGKRRGGIYHNSDRNVFGTQNWAPSVDDFNVRDL